jgi:hypothetical protein
MKTDPFSHCGKEVLRGREHIADALDPDWAEKITRALNRLSSRQRKNRLSAGSEGPRRGGEARAASLTPERRSEIAQAAAQARWGRKEEQ